MPFRTVTLKGMRGYDSSFSEVSSFVSTYGIRERIDPHEPFARGVQSIGRTPLDYSSRFGVELHPSATACQAMALIYRKLLATIRHNEEGIVNDLDTEFLHDFRVAVRRTRSGLAQVRHVLPRDVVEKAKRDFSWLGSISGATRDLDVYLLEREKYMCRLPERLRPKLVPFFADMAARRKQEHEELVRAFKSGRYREVVEWWSACLEGAGPEEGAANSGRPVTELAREIIFRKYRRVLKKGGAIKRSSPDDDLHRLRIQCKKLRYILEFFASLFPAGEVQKAIKQLKRLQDNLGTFNDLSVQQEMLRRYLAGIRPGSRKNQELAAAIGGLLTSLHREQQEVRKSFAARFRQFSSEENQHLYTELFG